MFNSIVDVGSRGMVSWQVYGGSTLKGLSDIWPVPVKDPRVNEERR